MQNARCILKSILQTEQKRRYITSVNGAFNACAERFVQIELGVRRGPVLELCARLVVQEASLMLDLIGCSSLYCERLAP